MSHLRIRQGGSVKRFHTWPTIGEQTVAAHTWGVLALILAFEPKPSVALLRRAVFHDLAEYETGDIPSSAKWGSRILKDACDRLEEVVNTNNGFPTDEELSPYEIDVLKAADLFEMLWFCYEQYMLGNRGLRVVYVRVLEAIAKRQWDPPLRTKLEEMLTELESLWLATDENEPS